MKKPQNSENNVCDTLGCSTKTKSVAGFQREQWLLSRAGEPTRRGGCQMPLGAPFTFKINFSGKTNTKQILVRAIEFRTYPPVRADQGNFPLTHFSGTQQTKQCIDTKAAPFLLHLPSLGCSGPTSGCSGRCRW